MLDILNKKICDETNDKTHGKTYDKIYDKKELGTIEIEKNMKNDLILFCKACFIENKDIDNFDVEKILNLIVFDKYMISYSFIGKLTNKSDNIIQKHIEKKKYKSEKYKSVSEIPSYCLYDKETFIDNKTHVFVNFNVFYKIIMSYKVAINMAFLLDVIEIQNIVNTFISKYSHYCLISKTQISIHQVNNAIKTNQINDNDKIQLSFDFNKNFCL